MKRVRAFLLTLALIPATVAAQPATAPAQDALLDRLAGAWTATGNVLRKSTTHDIDAAWVLNHQYLRLHEVSREKDANGGPQYEAFIYVATQRGADGEYTCLWLDSTSGEGLTNGISCHARRDGDRIPLVFRDKEGHVDFHTTWSYDRPSDTWTWDLDNVKDGNPVPFARFKLERNAASPQQEALRVLQKWTQAFTDSDVDAIVALYAPDALFLGTASKGVIDDARGVRAYFERALLENRPRTARVDSESVVVVSDSVVAVSGLDTITGVRDRKPVTSRGRVTFLVAKRGSDWKIVQFHRSPLPN